LFINWYSIKHKRTHFGNWFCFHPQVRGGRHILCWVP
jgi:hypothetical protein